MHLTEVLPSSIEVFFIVVLIDTISNLLENVPFYEVLLMFSLSFSSTLHLRFLFFPFCLFQPHLRNVMEYMLQVNKDPDEEVALEACEFW